MCNIIVDISAITVNPAPSTNYLFKEAIIGNVDNSNSFWKVGITTYPSSRLAEPIVVKNMISQVNAIWGIMQPAKTPKLIITVIELKIKEDVWPASHIRRTHAKIINDSVNNPQSTKCRRNISILLLF